MTALRLRLQKEVFDGTEEHLFGLAHIIRQEKDKKKKRDWLLAIATTKDVPVYVKLYLLKKNEKEVFKKKQEWHIRDLKILDGVSSESLDVKMDLDDKYTWNFNKFEEKEAFLKTLQQMCDKHNIGRRTKYMNMNWVSGSGDQSARGQGGTEQNNIAEADTGYQAINEKEAADLKAMMAGCENAISAADQFADKLAKELSVLDGDNIYSMMASEDAVNNLMLHLATSVKEVEKLEGRLNQYDDFLEHIRDSMEKMEGKTESLETVNNNNELLLAELDNVINKLQIPYEYQAILQEADLNNPDCLSPVIEAAQALSSSLLAPIPYSLTKMAAVQEQRKRCERWKDKFSKSFCRHMTNSFIHVGNEPGENLVQSSTRLTLPIRSTIHKELLPYAPLMHWLRQLEPKNYSTLQKLYTSSLAKLYDRDLARFIKDAYIRVCGSAPAPGTSQDLSSKKSSKMSIHGSQQVIGADRDLWGGEDHSQIRERFDATLELLLSCLEPVVMAEQNFCLNFFKMDSKVSDAPIKHAAAKTKTQKQVTEEVRLMMSQVFSSMEEELVTFLREFETRDSLNSMYSYVRLSSHVLQAQDTGSFLAITLGSALIHTKRNFDRLMQAQLRSIEDAKPARRSKCGIIYFVSNIGDFLTLTERIFRDSDRRSDIEKWYITMLISISDNIPRIAKEHGKTPQQVVIMENYHHLHAKLSALKISVLDNFKKDAKQRYQEALQNYVNQYFGRPLEKVNQFFDGVSAKLAAGVRETEISYQLQFSKQELRKVLTSYPGKEVKKGLADLYRKVEKHLCEEENLLQVVWRAMQEEFVRQYKYIEDLLQRCYPGAQISLDFTIANILEYFSDIAIQH